MIIIFILSIIFTSLGLFYLILNLNLFSLGYSFLYFVKFITRRIEFYYLFVGILLFIYFTERIKKNEFLLRHKIKFFRK